MATQVVELVAKVIAAKTVRTRAAKLLATLVNCAAVTATAGVEIAVAAAELLTVAIVVTTTPF